MQLYIDIDVEKDDDIAESLPKTVLSVAAV
jgi:hypothetical protein